MQILLVDDHADTVRTLSWLLRRQGYVVDTAGDLQSAKLLCDQKQFDLLITDIGLPDGTGLDLLRSLQGRPTRAIVLSGFGMEEDVQQSLDAGFQEHLTKPVSMDSLISAIQRVQGK